MKGFVRDVLLLFGVTILVIGIAWKYTDRGIHDDPRDGKVYTETGYKMCEGPDLLVVTLIPLDRKSTAVLDNNNQECVR